MPDHENQQCPRCGNYFTCKPGNITQCQCFGVAMSDDQKAFIAKRYYSCLCRNCLIHLQPAVNRFREEHGDR